MMTMFKIAPSFSRIILVGMLFLSSLPANSQVPPESQEAISQAELEQILAPIALYPDTILSHILVASTYPLEVVQAERWTVQNAELQSQEAVEAAQENGWDPSVQALVAFPQIIKRMSQDLSWTQKLGDAFLQDEEQVLASVQNLRELAAEAGSLDEMEKVSVSRDERIIIIEPREREIVYVPYYDTRVVYGPWRWRHHQPIYWDYPYADSPYYDDYYVNNHRNSFYWGPRISLSFGFFSNTFHWRNRHVVRISSRHYRPHRYNSHYDILDHRHAARWVHDARRRHGNRNRHIVRRNYQSHGEERNQAHRQFSQQQVQDQLANRRNNPVSVGNNPRAVRAVTTQRRPVTNRNTTRQRSTASTNYPSRNSRVVMPGRASSVEDARRSNSRSTTQRTTRQTTAQRQANRAASSPAQQRSAPRPTPKPAARRTAPKPVVAERRPVPKKAESATRTERRQPR